MTLPQRREVLGSFPFADRRNEAPPLGDGTSRLAIRFEEQCQNRPPSVKSIDQMFPYIAYGAGELCLDILQNRRGLTYDVAAILASTQP